MTSAPIATDLTLDSISPSLGARYCPNLHAFLKYWANVSVRLFGRVYREPDDTLWLGFPVESVFEGAMLSHVLCKGARTPVATLTDLASTLTEVDDFWVNYRRDGRCAIDPTHSADFLGAGTRWAKHGDERSCQWCKKFTQRLHRYTETEAVKREEWLPA